MQTIPGVLYRVKTVDQGVYYLTGYTESIVKMVLSAKGNKIGNSPISSMVEIRKDGKTPRVALIREGTKEYKENQASAYEIGQSLSDKVRLIEGNVYKQTSAVGGVTFIESKDENKVKAYTNKLNKEMGLGMRLNRLDKNGKTPRVALSK